MMRAPGFWWQQRATFTAWLLRPFSWLYDYIASARMRRAGHKSPVPVICVGNFTAGGAGKTPTAISLCQMLQAAGETPFFLSRGYGGTEQGPMLVDPAVHGPDRVGDEPLLLARQANTVIAADRVAGAELCHEKGATVIIMDDGMQNPALAKDFTIAVVDGSVSIGNGLPLPAGPLRLGMDRQWPRVDAVVIIGPGEAGERFSAQARSRGKPVFTASLQPDEQAVARLRSRKVLAFAGIGRPEKFFATLAACGALVERQQAFADHHRFTAPVLATLSETAKTEGLTLVTTEKDYIRIEGPKRASLETLPVKLVFVSGDPAPLLEQALDKARSSRASSPA